MNTLNQLVNGVNTAFPEPEFEKWNKCEQLLKEILVDKLSEALKSEIKSIDGEVPFAEFDVDSLVGANLTRRINQALKIKNERW